MSVRSGILGLWWILWSSLSLVWIIFVVIRLVASLTDRLQHGQSSTSNEYLAIIIVASFGPPLLVLALWYAGRWVFSGFNKTIENPPPKKLE
jgi:hypothetical protein